MTILAVSPHLDDAAFSAGGALATWSAAGHAVTVATVFTRSVADPTGFALACQTDKGFGPETDYLALRRDEDAVACAHLGARPVWLDHAEAPHRGYTSPAALFGAVGDDGDGVADTVRALVGDLVPDLIVSCQGLGGHVDHRVVIRAVADVADKSGTPTAWWRDAPYVLRQPDAPPAPEAPADGVERAVSLSDTALAAKLDACAAYRSQLGYQFGRDALGGESSPTAGARSALAAFALREGERLEIGGAAEALVTATPSALPVADA